MTTFNNIAMTRNTVKKYAALNAAITAAHKARGEAGEANTAIARAYMAEHDVPHSKAVFNVFETPAYKVNRDAYKAADEDYKAAQVALDKFKKRYLKSPVLGDGYRNEYHISLTHPRDGMGRLKLDASNLQDKTLTRSGCGYDKQGAVLGDWIAETFGDVLQSMNIVQIENFYGVNQYATNGGRVTIDGACGENCMIDVLNWLGYDVKRLTNQSRSSWETLGYIIIKQGA